MTRDYETEFDKHGLTHEQRDEIRSILADMNRDCFLYGSELSDIRTVTAPGGHYVKAHFERAGWKGVVEIHEINDSDDDE